MCATDILIYYRSRCTRHRFHGQLDEICHDGYLGHYFYEFIFILFRIQDCRRNAG